MNVYGEDVSVNNNGPGIRLTQQLPDQSGDDMLASAVPVFIGWWDLPHYENEALPMILRDLASPADIPDEAVYWSSCLRDSVMHYFDNGGGPCRVCVDQPPEAGGAFTPELSMSLKTWWSRLLSNVSTELLGQASLTLVAVPQLVLLIENIKDIKEDDTVRVLTDTWKMLLDSFSSRPDLFFVLDAPANPGTTTACIQAWRNDAELAGAGQRAALYGPHLITDYPGENAADAVVEDGFRVLPPCGAVLGVYARTDAYSGVWKAPANEALAHVVRPQFSETLTRDWFSDDRASVNLIRSFAGRGTRVWGCRTLASDGEVLHRYVQVRRTLSWIETSLKEVCRFAVFEPNNQITWFQLRGLCRAWLRRLWLEGGLAGADEASACSVRVGLNESMTATDIRKGYLVVDVAVALLRPAEFITVKLVFNVGDGHE